MPIAIFSWIFGMLLLFSDGSMEPGFSGVGSKSGKDKICGLSLVAPPRPFEEDPMPGVCEVNADWLAVIPYAYSRKGEPRVIHNKSQWQWWGERPEGARKTINLAHEQGLKVMLKPHVWVPGGWSGNIGFSKSGEWFQWETDYEAYILEYAQMAEELNVDLFCIGNEFGTSVEQRPAFWIGLIDKVRKAYKGPIIYAANWDNYDNIPFWDKLDLIGVNAYFPLSSERTPSVRRLAKAWRPITNDLEAFHQLNKKPIIFTEFGYLSVDQCAHKTWELEQDVKRRNINEEAQANALDALFSVFWEEPYWAGGFLWKWFPNMQGHEGYPERDYTPQGKKAQEILNKWYTQ